MKNPKDMPKLIPAADARQMNPDAAVFRWIDEINTMIIGAATTGKTFIRVPYELTEIGNGGARWKGVVGARVHDLLKEAGYKLESHWEERQFVDAYITIKWSDSGGVND
jgi:hypothetical protein